MTPDGASTVFETRDLTQTIRDGGTGEILSRSTWGPNGPEPDAVLQNVCRLVPPTTTPNTGNVLAPALTLYDDFSQRTSRVGRILALGVNASEYRQGDRETESVWVGYVTDKEIEDACHLYGKVQDLTDEAVDTVKRSGAFSGPADFGTKVHLELKNLVSDLNNPDLKPEVSISKSASADDSYGRLGTVRIDVLENAGKATVCVYDIKTGRSGFSGTRMSELAQAVQRRYPGTQRMLVIETRPSR